ncbi:hypothetical protein KORDIASMS9_03951 [Kordia sp. SMS9]|uniref:hypothetical protein n=1 Tax=Kordia sp. SMS9 TaxID=2282170 RepID=UPI000E107E01|nr:hypothetical protein [Kordia sp. SMS9]AXG71694.1 hypothetical protein KORDIASMS9_03951 [Kordia sp. SMS9]
MKKILITFMLAVCTLGMQASELDNRSYLKIELNEQEYISYPPKTDFLAKDVDGKVILNPSTLEKLKVYAIEKPITLYVFPSWRDEPDVYTLKSGTLYMKKTDRDYTKVAKKQKHSPSNDHFSRPTDGSEQQKASKRMTSNGVYLVGKRFYDYDAKNGYDVSLEFSNDVVFTYKNGFVNAWQYGEELVIENKYLVKTEQGTLKISYNPKTKKVWWVFDKDK